MTVLWVLVIPVIIFVGVIVPLWITFHYITAWLRLRKGGPMSAEDHAEMEALRQSADRLERRMESLETILDNETPNWRKQ